MGRIPRTSGKKNTCYQLGNKYKGRL